MSSFIKKNKLFFVLLAAFAGFLAFQLICYPKGHLVLFLDGLHTPAADIFFKFYTHIGDGLTSILVALVLFLLVKMRWGLLTLLTFALSGGISQLLKTVVFGPTPRPHTYFEGLNLLHPVEGVKIAYIYSFPSGHTISTFALFSMLVFLLPKNYGSTVLLFCMAALGGISRIYLGQHFTEDVLAGMLVGTLCSMVLYYWVEKKKSFMASPALDKPLLKLKK